ncbi:uncharacterized protein F5Z01DRAFT_640993 [Emericellopsis atlantica]|uniref:FAD dependent oxidoreductase domain-containing protein n=1 Tax=Emericellopsis atlantica TaxID=2614577 RepID=A0A9P7ZCN7_9HYPO|nr:uncharacterized protein F5Z01DRAFT_640993 [Emericellopsis atlantica]KAG9249654.1 hypothetical protein F5Z01DRAFT_640993 [Emericellopsis atlantica]
MAIAATLPKHCEVTIVARNLPGDPDNIEWASPWAGACWVAEEGSTPSEQTMQLDALAYWLHLAERFPASSVKKTVVYDVFDYASLEDIWYRDRVPDFRVMDKGELPPGAKLGVSYTTIILTPSILLPWLRKRLEAKGVTFERATVRSLADLKGMGHDVLINASGSGPMYLKDVQDHTMSPVRGQTVLVRSNFDELWIRRGEAYTYHLARGDGTAVLGGIKDTGSTDPRASEATRQDIVRRISENLPQHFPSSDVKDLEIIRDLVGVRPYRKTVRLEEEELGGQCVIHAYGTGSGGYAFSWGLARQAVDLVNRRLLALPKSLSSKL